MKIGQNIRKLREEKGLTQKELGEIIGVSDKAVSFWESEAKTPRIGIIDKLANYFSVTKDELIDGSLGDGVRESVILKAKKPIFNMIARDAKENLSEKNALELNRYLKFLYPEDFTDDNERREN